MQLIVIISTIVRRDLLIFLVVRTSRYGQRQWIM